MNGGNIRNNREHFSFVYLTLVMEDFFKNIPTKVLALWNDKYDNKLWTWLSTDLRSYFTFQWKKFLFAPE